MQPTRMLASVMLAAGLLAGLTMIVSLAGCGKTIADRPVISQARVDEIRENLGGGGGGEAEDQGPDPVGWATLTGSIKFASGDIGGIPAPSPLAVEGGDAAQCSRNGTPMTEEVVVNRQNGGLKNVVVFLSTNLEKKANKDLWLHPSAVGATEPVEFDQNNCTFLTHVLALQTSQPLLVLNSDTMGHNTDIKGTRFNRQIPPSRSEEFQFAEEQSKPGIVKCGAHPWMTAYILARSNGYFAVTDENGDFTIENLPAGVELSFKVWHEKVPAITDVTVNGAPGDWSRRGFKKTLDPGEHSMDVVLDAAPFQ